MNVTAPAKINLYLKVINKCEDGYHNIETLFERISILDHISVEISENDSTSIECDHPQVPTGPDSLLSKTVESFKKAAGIKHNFNISLKKTIPIGAGLGGGSSDAAAVLNGLNEITGYPLEKKVLMKIGGELGADIPFFITNHKMATGTGRGDVITKVENVPDVWHILINPPFEVSTRDVYSKVVPFGLTKSRGIDRMVTDFLKGGDIEAIGRNLHNDLQDIVLEEYPVLKKVVLEIKKTGASGVLLSGSGPTVFGVFDKQQVFKAEKELKKIFTAEKGWRVYAAFTY